MIIDLWTAWYDVPQEEGSVELKEAIDLQELRDKGTEFEVDISNVQQGTVVSHFLAFTGSTGL